MGAEVWLNAWGAPLRVRLTGNQTARRGYSNNIGVMDVPPYTVARTGGVTADRDAQRLRLLDPAGCGACVGSSIP